MNEELLNNAIFDALCDELKTRALSADDLLIRLKMGSFPAISKSDINRVLHRNRDFFQISQTNRLWSIRIAHSREMDDEKREFLEVTGIVLAITALTPLVVIPLALWFDGERPTLRSIGGGLIAVAGVVALALRR